MMTMRTTIISLLLLSIASLLFSLHTGSIHLSFYELLATLMHKGTAWQHDLVFGLRLPRTLSAFVTGGLLALAGALLQVLLRNPLADPYVLGISGGAAVGSLSLILLGQSSYWSNYASFLGALLSMFIVFVLARDFTASSTPSRLLLTGVMVAAGWGAMISFMLSIAPNEKLPHMLFWLMGDLSYAHFPDLELIILVLGLAFSMVMARQLNILSRGELQALSLGVSTKQLRLQLYFLSSLLTAAAVSLAGSIGFIGLIIPHLLRLVCGSDHRVLLPAAVLLGGTFLVTADSLSRWIFAPQQLPVGTITALIGVPLFLCLLRKG
ncbi:iron ABC transporter permease [soil metagenome]